MLPMLVVSAITKKKTSQVTSINQCDDCNAAIICHHAMSYRISYNAINFSGSMVWSYILPYFIIFHLFRSSHEGTQTAFKCSNIKTWPTLSQRPRLRLQKHILFRIAINLARRNNSLALPCARFGRGETMTMIREGHWNSNKKSCASNLMGSFVASIHDRFFGKCCCQNFAKWMVRFPHRGQVKV